MYPVPNPTASYWLSHPHRLRNVRTTPDLPQEADVVIIGSGMAGISTAYHILAEPEPTKLVMLEARELCSGATARNGGHCKIKTMTLANLSSSIDWNSIDQLQAYVHATIDAIKNIVDKEELDCQFELRRSFDVQTNAEESSRLKKIFDECKAAGRRWTKTTSYIDERFAEQVTSIKGATSAFSVPACSFWPYKFATQLVARLLERHPHHFNVQTNTLVKSVLRDEEGSTLLITNRGDIKARKVVFATNAYTAGLLPQFNDVIVPIRGMATHIAPPVPVHPHLNQTYNIDHGVEGVNYLNPRPDGSIVAGGGGGSYRSKRELWFNNVDDSVRFPTEVEDYWRGYMQRTFHGWENSQAESDKTWVGIMGITPDDSPHVGRIPGVNNQWILAGFNGGGMATILIASKAIAKMVCESKEFDDVRTHFNVPRWFGTSEARLQHHFKRE